MQVLRRHPPTSVVWEDHKTVMYSSSTHAGLVTRHAKHPLPHRCLDASVPIADEVTVDLVLRRRGLERELGPREALIVQGERAFEQVPNLAHNLAQQRLPHGPKSA